MAYGKSIKICDSGLTSFTVDRFIGSGITSFSVERNVCWKIAEGVVKNANDNRNNDLIRNLYIKVERTIVTLHSGCDWALLGHSITF